MKLFVRYRDTIVPLLVLLVAALLLANLVGHGILTASALAESKDALSALQSAVQVIFIILGAVFSYYRFFRGRTFISRADVTVNVSVIETTGEANLHWVSIELKNLGTVSIWDPRPLLTVHLFGPDGVSSESWADWREALAGGDASPTYSVVDSGETASFTTYHNVSKTVWAAVYESFVTDADGVKWKRSTMVPNKASVATNKRMEPSRSDL